MTKVITVQSDDVDRSTDSLESAAVEFFAQLSGKESSLQAMFQFLPLSRAQPVKERLLSLSFLVSLRTVLCLTAL